MDQTAPEMNDKLQSDYRDVVSTLSLVKNSPYLDGKSIPFRVEHRRLTATLEAVL